MSKTQATGLSDEEKTTIREIARGYKHAVQRGDCSASWAAETTAAHYTYPYATAAHFAAVRAEALKSVR